jgi:hypothetical protein
MSICVSVGPSPCRGPCEVRKWRLHRLGPCPLSPRHTATMVDTPAATREESSGFNIPYISNQLKGTSTSSAQGIFNFPGDIAHRAAH